MNNKVYFFSFEDFFTPSAVVNRHSALSKYSGSDIYAVFHNHKIIANNFAPPPHFKKDIRAIFRSFFFILKSFFYIAKEKKDSGNVVILYLGVWGGYFFLFYCLCRIFNFKLYHERTELPELMVGKHLFKKVDYWVYKKILTRVDHVFLITNKLRRFFIENIGVKKNKTSILNMCVDIAKFSIVEPFLTCHDKKIITFCGDMTSPKDNIDNLLNALPIILEKNPDAHLQLIGENNSSYFRKTLQPIIDNLSLHSKLSLLGTVPSSDVPLYLKQSHILVLSRENSIQAQYGFPTKLGEYVATGIPTVSTLTGEIDSFFTSDVDIFFVEGGNVDLLAKKIIEVLDDYDNACEVAKAGLLTAKKHFSAEYVAEILLKTGS